MLHTADLVTEIHRLAAKRGWSQAELARNLGVNRSVLVHARGGRRWLTAETIARVTRLFGDVPTMKDLVWAHLRYEYPVGDEEKGVLALPEKRSTGLPEGATEAIRRYVRAFPMRLVDGHGLLITGGSARLLTLASRTVADALSIAGVHVHRRSAALPLGPTEAAAIERSRLLVLERMDGASEASRRLLESHLGSERPVVVTSARDLEEVLDERVARLLRSRTTLLRMAAPSSDEDD